LLFKYFSELKRENPHIFKPIEDVDILKEMDRASRIAAEHFNERADSFSSMNKHLIQMVKKNSTNELKRVITYEINKRIEAVNKLKEKEEKYLNALQKSESSRMKDKEPKYLLEANNAYSKAQEHFLLFEPVLFEYGFGLKKGRDDSGSQASFEINLVDDLKVIIRGCIDRIDVNYDRKEFTVIDYKTGRSASISQRDVKEGKNSQLPVYEEYVRRFYSPALNRIAEFILI